MEQPTNKSSRAISLSLAAVLVVTLLMSGTVRPAGAQTNTSLGTGALRKNTTGTDNTALGFASLFLNTTGSNNTAVGANVLRRATSLTTIRPSATSAPSRATATGESNTATGFEALLKQHQRAMPTPPPGLALQNNTTGDSEHCDRASARLEQHHGRWQHRHRIRGPRQQHHRRISNTATGECALRDNTPAKKTSTALAPLRSNTAVSGTPPSEPPPYSPTPPALDNTAVGNGARTTYTGSGNIAVGAEAGDNLTTGNNNIDIGNQGSRGRHEHYPHRHKRQHRPALSSLALYTSPVYGSPVYVNANGRLGVAVSSARYKRDIHDMGDASARLLQLRPVSFRYRQDPKGMLQYGLVAEEVERVYPELVTRDDDGKVMGVRYDVIPALLLNEMLKQARDNQRKDALIAALQKQLVVQQRQVQTLEKETARIDALTARLNTLEAQARKERPERLAAAMPIAPAQRLRDK